jgi:hypothetical protein
MGAVQEFCDRALMIQDSKVLMIGKPREIALNYEVANAAISKELTSGGRSVNPPVKLERITVTSDGKKTSNLNIDQVLDLEVEFKVKTKIPVQFNISLAKSDGTYLAGMNTTRDLKKYEPEVGTHKLYCTFKAGQVPKGLYYVNVAVYTYEEPAELIDILDINYGVETPRVSFLESSKFQNGEFYIQGHWSESIK